MSRHFLLYWRPETVELHLSCDYLLRNAGSSQLGRVASGDVLWIITTGEGDSLGLAGRLRVGRVLSFAEARRHLQTDDLWPSEYHALAVPGTASRMRGINLAEAAADLRFTGGAFDRFLVRRDGTVEPVQMKRMLELAPHSSALLNEIWMIDTQRRAAIWN